MAAPTRPPPMTMASCVETCEETAGMRSIVPDSAGLQMPDARRQMPDAKISRVWRLTTGVWRLYFGLPIPYSPFPISHYGGRMAVYRPTITGTRHMIAAGHHAAAHAGFTILEAG